MIPLIKKLFSKQYKKVFKEFYKTELLDETEIEKVQGYYFAKTSKGEFKDSKQSDESREIYETIMKDKEKLLSFEQSPIEFIFSHSALGVGWDNPNIFNITLLNRSCSEIKKRQEIGRGLRLCVNQKHERVSDIQVVPLSERINLLTIIPMRPLLHSTNQYQAEIRETYGTTDAGADIELKIKPILKSQRKNFL
jgi:type III restriction enzyme